MVAVILVYMTIIIYNVKGQKRREIRMKVTREQAARNRERIVEAAAQRFRERGFEGIGVADLMREAGLTHGGVYGHFSSKEDLIAEASERVLMGSLALFTDVAERAPADPLPAIANAYLTTGHRDKPGEGCLLPALGPEVSRQGAMVRLAVTDHLRAAVNLLTKLIPGSSKTARRQKAISTYATFIGTMGIARAGDD